MLERPDVLPYLSIISNKLDEKTFLNELFNDYFQLETVLGIMAIVFVISAILVPIPFIGWAFQFSLLLE